MAPTISAPKHREIRDSFHWTQECLPLGTLNDLEGFDRSAWLDADEEAHGCQNAYLLDGDRSLLFDTLTQPNADDVVGLIDDLLDGEPLDYLAISHPEANHAGNTFTILDAYPEATLLVPGEAAGHGDGHGAEHELYHLAADTPDDGEGLGNDIEYVTDGDTVDLGEYTVTFREPVVADHSFTLWMTEETTNALFTVDWMGFLHQESNCVSYAGELDHPVTVEQVFRFHALAFPWLRFADPDQLEAAVAEVRELDPDVVAPAHGMVMVEDVDDYLGLFLAAAERLAVEGEPENMRSKLEYILRPPAEA
jgi:flavorubredoxin